jgi:hypothetical protein
MASTTTILPATADVLSEPTPASFEDYADVEFAAFEFECDAEDFKRRYHDMRASIGIAFSFLEKDHVGCLETINRIDAAHDGLLVQMLDDMKADKDALRKIVEMIEIAETRIIAAACRMMKERGERC